MTLTLFQFGLYLCGMLALGFWAMRRTQENSDFVIGGRRMGPYTSALSAGASDMSAWLLLGLPGAVFSGGLVEGFWIGLGLILGAWANWYFVAPRLRVSTQALDAITLPSWLSKQFPDREKLIRLTAAFVILIFFTLYLASGLKGGTLLFSHTFGASESISLFVTLFVVVSYTFLGGYIAVCWTDLIQGLLMMLALIFCCLFAWLSLNNGFTDILRIQPQAFSINTGWISALSLLAWGLGYFGQPHILTRFIGIRSEHDIKLARRVGISWMTVCLCAAVLIGLMGIALQSNLALEGLLGTDGNSERIFLILTTVLFHPIFSGFVLAAVLAAVMSTADSQLLVLASTISEDLNLKLRLDQKALAKISRGSIIAFAFIAWLIAANDSGTILSLVGYAWSGFGAAFGPLILLTLLWKKVSSLGALAGMVSGALAVFVCKTTIKIEDQYFIELLPAFFISLFTIVITSKVFRSNPK